MTREAPKSPIKSQDRMEGGVITYEANNNKKTIMYFLKDCDKPPRAGDHVRFDICQVSTQFSDSFLTTFDKFVFFPFRLSETKR